MDSKITAQYAFVASSFSNASASLKGRKVTSCWLLSGALMVELSVTATAAEVLPWKAPLKAMTFFRPV
jgi:hypothetical protein